MPGLIISAFVSISVFYLGYAVIAYLATGDNHMKATSFLYFSNHSNVIMASMEYFFLLTALFNIPFNCITTSENFEGFNILGFLGLSNSENDKRYLVLTIRYIILITSYIVSILLTNLIKIFDLGGTLISPFLSFILPVGVNLT